MIIGSMLFKHLQMKVRMDRLFYTITFTMPALVLLFGVVHTQTIIGLFNFIRYAGMAVDGLSRRLGQKYFYPIKTEHDWCK